MHVLNAHGRYIKEHASSEMANLRALQKSVTSQVRRAASTSWLRWRRWSRRALRPMLSHHPFSTQRDSLSRVCDQTKYSIEYLTHLLKKPHLALDDVQQAQELGSIADTAA